MISCRTLLFVLFLMLVAPATIPAADVVNLRPTFLSNKLILEYDLRGGREERSACVEVSIVFQGKRHTAAMLTLSGDFGKDVPIGTQRRIVWQHLKDVPEGLDSTFKCIVNVVPEHALNTEDALPAGDGKVEARTVSRQTVADRQTGLLWVRSGSLTAKPMSHSAALSFIQQLNSERFAGFADWRLPTRAEFEGLVLPGQQGGWWTRVGHFIADHLATFGFEDVLLGNYWTSTASCDQSGYYFAGNTWNGVVRAMNASHYYYVWPVRSLSTPRSTAGSRSRNLS